MAGAFGAIHLAAIEPYIGEYAVGLGTLALINAGLAQSKNRSGLAWFLVSLLLGPVATFLLVVFDKVDAAKS